MKNRKNTQINEEQVAMTGYPMSAGGSDKDMSGRGSMIAQPVVGAAPATARQQIPTIMASQMAAAPVAQSSSQSEDAEDQTEETEEGEETEEEEEAIETNEELNAQFRDSLVSLLGENVDPSLVSKLEAIFEAAVTDRVERTVAQIVESVDGNVKTYLDEVTESLVEKVDDYLDYVVEEWMTENAVAVEQGIKTQIAENFISGLKNLFENHYIDVPAEKYNVLDELYAQNRELENKLNESVKHNMNLKKEVSLTECAGIFVAETRDLADTQVAKLQGLMENVSFETPEEYREKLVAIRENYLTRPRPASDSDQTAPTPTQPPPPPSAMASLSIHYTKPPPSQHTEIPSHSIAAHLSPPILLANKQNQYRCHL